MRHSLLSSGTLVGIALLCLPSFLSAQQSDVRFTHLTVKDGLSGNIVRCIAQDSVGFMWFAMQDGLNRYDGRTVRIYRDLDSDAVNLGDHAVQVLAVDPEGTLWVASGGLYKYVREEDRFVHVPIDHGDPEKPAPWVDCVLPDEEGILWVGTSESLEKFDIKTGKFTRVDLGGPMNVRSIADDHGGNLWLSIGYQGLLKLDKPTFRRELFPIEGHQHQVYADTSIVMAVRAGPLIRLSKNDRNAYTMEPMPAMGEMPISACRDRSGRIWVGTLGDGLSVFDPSTGSITRFNQISSDPGALSSSFLGGLCVDRQGNLWVSTTNGVNVLTRWGLGFTHVVHNPENANSLVDGEIRTILEDSYGNIWAGTWGRGLSRWDQRARTFHTYYRIKQISPFVSVVYQDRKGVVWIGTNQDGGLVKWNRETDTFLRDDLDPARGVRNMVTAMLEDRRGVFWVGTPGDLCSYDRTTLAKRWYVPDTTVRSYVTALFEDHSGRVWMTTTGQDPGLFEYDRDRDRFVRRKKIAPQAIHEDRDGRLWLGTSDGLFLYDRSHDTLITVLTGRNGLGGNVVYGILEDDGAPPGRLPGRLWLATNKGLTKYDPDTRELKNYGANDGYPFPDVSEQDFSSHAYFTTTSGWMLVGLGNGFVRFHPDSIHDNPHVPPVVLTDFKLLNEPVRIGPDSPLKQSITRSPPIILLHDQNTFSFEFAALDYTLPATNQYAHQLVGFDKGWVLAGTRNFAQYTNLPHGHYTFRAKGSNNDGVWNEEGVSIDITITPPWWKTVWAYTGYGLAVLAVFYTIRRSEKHRDRLRHQAELERTRAESLMEVDTLKSRFFANISHEFRTPLTLIKGPLEGMLAEEQDETRKRNLGMMERNAARLLRLVNQLLDLSKLESGAMKLQAAPGNIVPFVKGIASSFESSAGVRNIAIVLHAERDEMEMYFDRDKMEKILTNLLSNAFKFTPRGGTVSVSTQATTFASSPGNDRVDSVSITIADTGIGIPAEELPRVFDRFYQVDQSQTREFEGSGIGLALTKELVELHHGRIDVRSEVGKGTEFTVTLPLGRQHLKDDEVTEEPSTDAEPLRATGSTAVSAGEESRLSSVALRGEEVVSPEGASRIDSAPIVLIVEDNADVRAYMKEYLVKGYQVLEAHDGAQGIEKAQETIPDLIISDVMMPKKDGYEVCRTLKLDERTSHIPIILLTARAGTENKIEGLETGADDYLTKPFDAKELLVRVRNLIQTRRKLRERFSTAKVLKPGEIAVTSLDDTFLQKAKCTVEKHIGEEEFGVEEFAREMNMSRSQLLRKLTALTGLSVRDFVRYIRLHRAMDLLKQQAGTVAEIGYSVGFGSPAYFTKCFHDQFGFVPTDVQNQT